MKKIIPFTVLIILLLFNSNSYSQNIVINGKVNKTNALIRLFTYNDMLTCEQTKIIETYSDDNGNFHLEANINDITMSQIAVNLERLDILLNPNSFYNIEITIPEQSDDISYFERQTPSLKIIDAKDKNLYYQYFMSEMIIDDFVINYFNRLYRGHQTTLLDTIDNKINKELGEISSGYIKDYLRYRKAAIQMAIDNDDAKRVINQYYNKQNLLYSQPAYMDLFKEIFDDYLLSRQFEPSEFLDMFHSGYDKFYSYLKEKDAFLSDNPCLAELIVIWNMKRMYYENPKERKIILKYFDEIKQNTKYQKHKQIINDIQNQIKRLAYNSAAPMFTLKNAAGQDVKLSDYKNNMVLLQFVEKVSPMIEYHFDKLKKLALQWQDTVNIITIATDDSFENFKQMFGKKGFNWTLLNLGNDFLLLEKYQIKTFPDYIIIKPGCKIGMAPAPAPDQYLDYHIRRIFKHL